MKIDLCDHLVATPLNGDFLVSDETDRRVNVASTDGWNSCTFVTISLRILSINCWWCFTDVAVFHYPDVGSKSTVGGRKRRLGIQLVQRHCERREVVILQHARVKTIDPHLIHGSLEWSHVSQLPKRHLDRFSRFCTAHPCADNPQNWGSWLHLIHGSLGTPKSDPKVWAVQKWLNRSRCRLGLTHVDRPNRPMLCYYPTFSWHWNWIARKVQTCKCAVETLLTQPCDCNIPSWNRQVAGLPPRAASDRWDEGCM